MLRGASQARTGAVLVNAIGAREGAVKAVDLGALFPRVTVGDLLDELERGGRASLCGFVKGESGVCSAFVGCREAHLAENVGGVGGHLRGDRQQSHGRRRKEHEWNWMAVRLWTA